MSVPPASSVRPDYMHELVGACQRFVGSVLTLAPGAFVDAVEQLTSEAPDTDSTAELISAWTLITATTLRGAEAHHRWFHRCFGDTWCTFRSAPLPPVGSFAPEHVRPLLMTWAGGYMDCFRHEHVWPVAIRAAALMQARAHADWYIDELASAVGTSTATLERSFNRIYGISPQPYHSLLRLRLIATEIRAGESATDGVLLELGWRSPKDAYRAFRKVTGVTPAAVRRLSDVEFAALMQGPLALPLPRPASQRSGTRESDVRRRRSNLEN
jgi:AraC-like DNA-binding protein